MRQYKSTSFPLWTSRVIHCVASSVFMSVLTVTLSPLDDIDSQIPVKSSSLLTIIVLTWRLLLTSRAIKTHTKKLWLLWGLCRAQGRLLMVMIYNVYSCVFIFSDLLSDRRLHLHWLGICYVEMGLDVKWHWKTENMNEIKLTSKMLPFIMHPLY